MRGRADAVDGLPTWVRWIIVAVVGLSPILTFWMARTFGHLRRKLWRRPPSGALGPRRTFPVRQKQSDGDGQRG